MFIGAVEARAVSVLTGTALLPAYARFPVTFVDGDGSWLIADDGQRYLDLIAGIAVVSLGHCHPAPLEAAREQLERLWHVSNLYSTEPMEHLAERLSDRFGGSQAFFCNSGTEAVEAAIKWARKSTEKTELVALEGSFHGRTMGALSITGQPPKRAPFEPLIPGARFATPETLAEHVGPQTAAIFLEPVQGEGGVRPLDTETLKQARALADEFGAMLVFDEVQTGVGRTGEFFAWQRSGVRPDALTMAKGLANGLPIGALLVRDGAPSGFVPGDHASTFGGNPVACAAACAVVDAIDDDLLAHVRDVSALFVEALPEVRGAGLLLAVELHHPAGPVAHAALEKGLLVGTAGDTALRITPPLTISRDEAQQGIELLREVMGT
jgi:predicted acetylornithine/succinylornithine family transaminase